MADTVGCRWITETNLLWVRLQPSWKRTKRQSSFSQVCAQAVLLATGREGAGDKRGLGMHAGLEHRALQLCADRMYG